MDKEKLVLEFVATSTLTWTQSYKTIPALIYTGFVYAKIFDLEFPYKIFGVAKSSVDLRWNFFIGSGPGYRKV